MYGWKYLIGLFVLLTAVTLAVHGHALGNGLFLDDHWHELRLAENDWSWSALLSATTIAPGRFMNTWWQSEPISWWYIRPFAMFISKLVYHLSGGSVKALHGLGLALHLGNAMLVHHLVLRMTKRRWWAIVAALLMLVYSHSVYAAVWLAAQNALLQTFLMLLALLAYVRASGLDIYAGPKDEACGSDPNCHGQSCKDTGHGLPHTDSGWHGQPQVARGYSSAATGKLRDAPLTHAILTKPALSTTAVLPDAPSAMPVAVERAAGEQRIPALQWRWLGMFFLLWALAMFSRESAVVLPAMLVGFDLAFGGWRHVRTRFTLYAVLAVAAVAFICWRVIFFNHPMPDFYVQRPHGPEYLLWWLAKLLHYVTATVWLSPMTIGPSGRFNPWREVPGDCVLMLTILVIMGVGYYMASRRVRGYWLWPLWIFLGLLPVVPILATPHNGYLPSVGFAIAMAIGPALRDKTKPTSVGRWCAGVATWFLIATSTYVPIYRPMWYSMLAAERMTIDQVMRMPPGPGATDIFFINVPFVNIYACYHIDEAMGRGAKLGVACQAEPTYRTHALTYAPDLLRMDQPCQIKQIDARRFRVAILGDRPYFSGSQGRYFIEGMRPGKGRLVPGQQLPGELFDVRVLKADEQGVRELEFNFHEPLASDQFCFYVGTPSCAAARVRFAGPDAYTSSGPTSKPEPQPGVWRGNGAPDLVAVTAALTRLRGGQAAAADVLFAATGSPDLQVRSVAGVGIKEVCQPVIQALAAPVITPLPLGGVAWANWESVREWWSWHVDDTAVRLLPRYQKDFAELRWQRDALFRIRKIASTIIQTDLYLTGPAFPGPQ